jgi:hypothetical protein
MTDLINMTKSAINALLTTPLTASQLKKKSHADLVAMFDDMSATDALDADLRDARTDDPTPPVPKAPRKPRTPRVLDDRVLIAPGKAEDVRPTKAGSKRHLMAEALEKGATIEDMVELLGWNKDTVSSALRTDMGALGLGVERKAGRYHLLLPAGVKRIPAHDANTNRAAALVAACR